MSCNHGRMTMAAAVALAIVASGCAPVDPGFGEAQRYDMAVQTIDPDPVYPEEGAKPGDSGVKASDATKRYRSDKVKATESMSATESGSGTGPN